MDGYYVIKLWGHSCEDTALSSHVVMLCCLQKKQILSQEQVKCFRYAELLQFVLNWGLICEGLSEDLQAPGVSVETKKEAKGEKNIKSRTRSTVLPLSCIDPNKMKTVILESEEAKNKLYFSHFLYREFFPFVVMSLRPRFLLGAAMVRGNPRTISGWLKTDVEPSRPTAELHSKVVTIISLTWSPVASCTVHTFSSESHYSDQDQRCS